MWRRIPTTMINIERTNNDDEILASVDEENLDL